jgi:hypothetical protein
VNQQFVFNFDAPLVSEVQPGTEERPRYDFSCPYPDLISYGIFGEDSHIRAHVGPVARKVYVYKTADMTEKIISGNYTKLPAYQNGVNGVTGYGPIVPLKDIPFVIPVSWTSTEWWNWFNGMDDLGLKGKTAVKVVRELMLRGRFPIFVIPEEVTDIRMDIKGTDIIISGKWHIQVKCDWKAGPADIPGCSGNLFVQTHEQNPKKIY